MSGTDHRSRGEPPATPRPDPAIGHLSSRLGDVARELRAHRGPDDTVAAVLDAVVQNVPGADHASMTVVNRQRGVHTVQATSDLARGVDQLQYRTQQGPCLDTLYEHVTVRADDLEREGRWPRFAPRAAAAGVHSMLSVHLSTDEDDLGALNMFDAQPRAFTDESERIALAVASHAAIAVTAAHQIATLREAVDSRGVIGEAKGMLMERYHLTADVAFAVMVRYSRTNNVKLVDLARRIANRHDLRPPLALARSDDS